MSAITAWCDACDQEALVSDAGTCVWCDGPTRKKRSGGKPKGRYRRMTDDQVRAAHRLYVQRELSCWELGRLLWERFGYRSPQSAGEAVSRAFKSLGLPLRSQHEVTVKRNFKHGHKVRAQTNGEQNAYRRWLADQRGWKATQGPGRPTCRALKTGACGGKGKPCTRPAVEGSTFCQSHDPARELARQAVLAKVRSRIPEREMVPLEPFAIWLGAEYRRLGTLAAVGDLLGCSKSTASNLIRRERTHSHGRRGPWEAIRREVVERYLERAGGPSLAELYGTGEPIPEVPRQAAAA